MSALRATIERAVARDWLAGAWTELEARAPARFFLSWPWIGTWLEESGLEPLVAVAREGERVAALALLLPRAVRRHGWLGAKAWHLHSSGDPALDSIAIEYNGLLAESDAAAQACLQAILEADWEELHCPGAGENLAALANASGLSCHVANRQRVVAARLDQPSQVSSNTGYQIRRALRLYEQRGPVRLAAATSPAEALAFFAALGELHQAYWTGRGKLGAFASPFFVRFHRALIERHFDCVEVLRITAGEAPIGYLYNFLWRGQVYSYQSGFSYEADAKLKPGLVCHHLAMDYHRARGHRLYDFLAGDSRYKLSLGTAGEELTWLVLQKPRAKFAIEQGLRRLKQAVKG